MTIMKPQIKLDARTRVAQFLAAALDEAKRGSYQTVTREQIASACDVPPSLIHYHMGTMPELRRKVMREAVRVECLPVIAQGLAMKDRQALKASEELRARALATLGA